ncbi:MAG: hypothetical protein D6679_13355 [Candidatus Hydrogenedentota bacterium]|nr:MAG: hypothetical protein D6679_13355 [Candidatus Hydrogenedentota bacterium]
MKQACRGLLGILAVVLLAGCFSYSERLEIEPDGSGRLEMHFTLPEYLFHLDKVNLGAQMAETENPASKISLEAFLDEIDSGNARVFLYNEENSNGGRTISLGLEIRDVTRPVGTVVGSQRVVAFRNGPEGIEYVSYIRKPQSVGNDEPTSEEEEEDNPLSGNPIGGNPMQKQFLTVFFAGQTFDYTVALPKNILSSNAERVSGSEATWSFPLSEMAQRKNGILLFAADHPKDWSPLIDAIANAEAKGESITQSLILQSLEKETEGETEAFSSQEPNENSERKQELSAVPEEGGATAGGFAEDELFRTFPEPVQLRLHGILDALDAYAADHGGEFPWSARETPPEMWLSPIYLPPAMELFPEGWRITYRGNRKDFTLSVYDDEGNVHSFEGP